MLEKIKALLKPKNTAANGGQSCCAMPKDKAAETQSDHDHHGHGHDHKDAAGGCCGGGKHHHH